MLINWKKQLLARNLNRFRQTASRSKSQTKAGEEREKKKTNDVLNHYLKFDEAAEADACMNGITFASLRRRFKAFKNKREYYDNSTPADLNHLLAPKLKKTGH